jgi:integrase
LFNWDKVKDNPAKGITPNATSRDARYLNDGEIAALTTALNSYEDQDVADIFRLLMFTGARRGETQSATWEQMDLKPEAGFWTKPSSHTKTKKIHRVPMSPPALDMLTKRHAKADAEIKKLEKERAKAAPTDLDALKERIRRIDTFVFPAAIGSLGHIVEIKKAWASLCKKAKIKGARIHDLRHTAASVLASSNVSLVLIGQMLGHTQTSTTARYAHLYDEAQRATADVLGAAISKAGNERSKR